jgi:hypothetical protein
MKILGARRVFDLDARRAYSANEAGIVNAKTVQEHFSGGVGVIYGEALSDVPRYSKTYSAAKAPYEAARKRTLLVNRDWRSSLKLFLEALQSFQVQYGQASVTYAHESSAFESAQRLIDALARKTYQMRQLFLRDR